MNETNKQSEATPEKPPAPAENLPIEEKIVTEKISTPATPGQEAPRDNLPPTENAIAPPIEGEVELPHVESDIKPDELVEPESEVPEPELKQNPDDDEITVPEDKVPLPEVYGKGQAPPVTVPDQVLEKHSEPPSAAPHEELREKEPPRPLIPKLTRAESEATDNFKARFRQKLLDLLHLANQKRADTVEDNLEKIMAFAREHQKVTNDDIEQIIDVKDDQATKYLNRLIKQKKLVRFGKKSNIFYKPIN